MSVRYADMFAGIGGFALGLRRALGENQVKHAYGCDIDKDAALTYERNFGQNILGDISTEPMASLPDFDIVFGGFPCQPFSRNGIHYQKGRLDDVGKESLKIQDPEEKRDKLYLHLVEALEAKHPARFLFENVKGLKTIMDASGRSYFDTIKQAFEEAGPGYDVFTKVLDTADFGLPQQRKRLFFVGFRKDIGVTSFTWPIPVLPRTARIRDILEPEDSVPSKYLLENLWSKRVCRILKNPDGTPKKRLRALKEAKEAEEGKKKKRVQEAEAEYLKASERAMKAKGTTEEKATEKKVREAEKRVTKARDLVANLPRGRIIPLAVIYKDTPSGGPRQMDKLYSIEGISPTIATFSTPAIDAPGGWRILTPRECARLQGFPNSFKLPLSDAKAYRQIGNAVSVRMVEAIVRRMFD